MNLRKKPLASLHHRHVLPEKASSQRAHRDKVGYDPIQMMFSTNETFYWVQIKIKFNLKTLLR